MQPCSLHNSLKFCIYSYFVPEDGDDELTPNVFLAPKPKQPGYPPTLGEVKQAFPLPGRYHFRFKSSLVPGSDREKGSLAVWMDAVDDRMPVPTWRSAIIAKVTRIGVDDDDDDDDDDFGRTSSVSSANRAPEPQRHTPSPAAAASRPPPTPSPSLDLFGDSGSTPGYSSQTTTSAPPSVGSGNLLDGNLPTGTNNNKQDSLLDMHTPVYSNAPPANSAHSDFFGMMATPSPPVSGNYTGLGMQQQQQQPNAFNSFSQQNGPFGDLGTPWKT